MDRSDGSTVNMAAYSARSASSIPATASTTSAASSSTPTSATATTASLATTHAGSHDAAVGAGVGVPLAVCLLVALGLLWQQSMQRRKLQRKLDQLSGLATHDSNAPYMALHDKKYAVDQSPQSVDLGHVAPRAYAVAAGHGHELYPQQRMAEMGDMERAELGMRRD
ncbi:hypothetical protein LTR17_014243 [Elasticomyces elasticus]|nr:hypothetical protein LTR17_014243 [Elasticomyces elasticus]